MKISLIKVPYYLDQERTGMGNGPQAFIDAGAENELKRAGHTVQISEILRDTHTANQLESIVELNTILASQVARASENDAFPLVLAGSCISCLGILAGLNAKNIGIVWFDAHGDFNTPQTSPSGFLDGMALAMAAGLCHEKSVQQTGLIAPVQSSNILHLGGRDFDPPEWQLVQEQGIKTVTAQQLQENGIANCLAPKIKKLCERVTEIYLHLDIDVLDSKKYPANEFKAPGGLELEELLEAIEAVSAHFTIRAAAVTAYNPEYDPQSGTLNAGIKILRAIADMLKN